MALPTTDEFLVSLKRMRRNAVRLRNDAMASGDGRTARSFQRQIREVERMITRKGGSIDA